MYDSFLKENNVVSIDYETTGFNAYKGDTIFAFSVSNWQCDTKVFRLDNVSKVKNAVSKTALEFFHKDTIIKVAHNAKFEMGFTSMHFNGTLPESPWHDTYIMSKMLKNLLPRHALEVLADLYFKDIFPEYAEKWKYYDKEVKRHMSTQKRLMNNYPKRVEKEIFQSMWDNGIQPLVIYRPNYGLIPTSIMRPYQEADSVRCMLLFRLMLPKIKEDKRIWKDYLNEIRLLKTTQKMEQRGMMVHERNSHKIIDELTEKLAEIDKEKKKIFKFDINLDSTDQLQKHLFGYKNPKKHEKLNEEWKKREPVFNLTPINMTAGGSPSASKDDILELQKKYPRNKALDLLLRYRAWSKGKTMVYSYLAAGGDDLIIHPTTNTNKARTGRQSVSSPNLQNVAKEATQRVAYGIPARRCFKPRPGYVYFFGDHAGIEMRLIIAASGEQELIDKLNEDVDYDVHTDSGIIILADELEKEKDKKKIKDLRAGIKDATFGRCYGAGLPTFAHALHKTIEEAKPGWERFAEKRPSLFNFTRDMIAQVKKTGYVTGAFGRKLRVEKDYYASNYRIQGDASGILKRGQNNIDDYIMDVWDGDYDEIAILLSVHDELIVEMHRSLLSKKYEILHDLSYCMTNIPEIVVPLAAEWKMSTTNWQDAEGIKI
jgi:DNA polymerase I-like protein with 3'-5' exonuclease and polymerase domains